MSRIGKAPVTVPSGVTVTINGQNVEVKGPKGTLAIDVPEPITIAQEGDEIVGLVHHGRRRLARDDRAEDAVAHREQA